MNYIYLWCTPTYENNCMYYMKDGNMVGKMLGQAIGDDGMRLYYVTGDSENEVIENLLSKSDIYNSKYPNGYETIFGDDVLKASTFKIVVE